MQPNIQFSRSALADAVNCLPRTQTPHDATASLNAQRIAAALAGLLLSSEPVIAEQISAEIGIADSSTQKVAA